MKQDIYSDYTNKYGVSKTLRFELRPQGKTQEYIEQSGVLSEDEQRVIEYKEMKKILDEYYKAFLERTLSSIELTGLDAYYELYSKRNRTEKEERELEKMQATLRKQVVQCFMADTKYRYLFKKEVITKELNDFVKTEKEKQVVANFQKFTTYFQGFFDNRKNVFSDEAKSTAASYRIVNQNFPRFIDNMHAFDIIKEAQIENQIVCLEKALTDDLRGRKVKEFFELTMYTNLLTNKDITLYNTLIGGKTLPDGTKIQGINEYINLYNQGNSKNCTARRLPKLKPLYKQILADKESLAFVEEALENDSEVLIAVNGLIKELSDTVLSEGAEDSLVRLLRNMEHYDMERIYIKNGPAISELSNAVLGDWSIIKNALEQEYDELNKKGKKSAIKTEAYLEKRTKAIKGRKSYSLAELNRVVQAYGNNTCQLERFYITLAEKDGKNLLASFESALENAQLLLNTDYKSKHGLASDRKNIAILKALLDSVKAMEGFVKPLLGNGTEADKDAVFYGELDRLYKVLNRITPLYNKVRNYVTRKPFSREKIKLNFQKPKFLDGWAKNKEKDDLGVILKRKGLFYLGIIRDRNIFEKNVPEEENDYYEKMEYKQIKKRDLNHVFFAQCNREQFQPSDEIMHICSQGTFKEGTDFRLEDCHKLIDFYKKSIKVHPDWSKFDFEFRETCDYKDINSFYHDVEQRGYSLQFKNISKTYIDQLVEDGRLYLFQIYNKDFSEWSKGTPNLHTIYWRMLFDEKNLANVVYKLNGYSEMFYRKAGIDKDDRVIHPKYKPIANKNYEAERNEETSIFPYDLVKDKRYTVDKYQLHVPITMNFCAEGRGNINREVVHTIQENDDINVIGIDRGERNLLYISVINSNGIILHQQSLNVIENDKGYSQDYHRLLDKREKEMDAARRNWMDINSIKELKEGYLSQAIHVITELMIQYNAIVVLEDLNFGFMNGRKKVGKQVYQKFEKMLIDKLNYLVDKKKEAGEVGGALKALQLTSRFESFAKLGKQSGFLFYIPAWNTSKIDPTTGFVNLLYPKYTNMVNAKAFIEKFDCIKYNPVEGYFEFAFDYAQFTDKAVGTKEKWTVCSYGTRVVNFRNPEKNGEWDAKEINITQQIEQHLKEAGINIGGENLVNAICSIDAADFFRNFIGDIKLVLQIRNSVPNTEIDYMLSPVKNEKGEFFDTRKYEVGNEQVNYLPMDADANGAYNIARKGLMLMDKIRKSEDDKVKLTITNREWMEYAQRHLVI